MIEPIPFEADHVFAVRVSGRVEDAEFDALADDVERRLQRHPKLSVYVELEHFEGMSAHALLKDLRLGFGHLDRFDREAVVTDAGWARTLAKVAGPLVPGVEVKVFDEDQKDAAQRWVAGQA